MYIHRSSLLRVRLWASVLSMCWAQTPEQLLAQDPCASSTTCSQCIRLPSCAWCFQPDFNDSRCFNPTVEGGGIAGCDEALIFNPDNQLSIDPMYNMERVKSRTSVPSGSSSYEESMRAKGSSAASGSGGAVSAGGGESLVQIKPQRIKLNMRMNQMQRLSFTYTRAQDDPVDLYYLMGLSRSMKNDKQKLSALGSLLSAAARNLSSNFRIGFGSLFDKSAMPHVSTVSKDLKSPCDGCAAPYEYQNQMSLGVDTDYFEKAVATADVSGNPERPAGALDAILQAVVCREQIGWRDRARRLLVFLSDDGFHYTGDTKVGGTAQPDDGGCHMQNNSYTRSTRHDWPTTSQISHKVKEHAINVIFAVTADQISAYEQLSAHIEGSSCGALSNDTDNVVDLIREQYNKITSSVEMKDSSSDAVQIVYYSSCLADKELIQTNRCEDLKVGDVVKFTAEITLKECPADRSKWKQSFELSPAGAPDSLLVELEMTCECPCERPGHPGYSDRSPVCSGGGALACGVCACQPGRFGKHCECSALGGLSANHERGCRPTNHSAGPLCSNRGVCICDVCECNMMEDPLQVISGPFCECDNFSCDTHEGVLCSGPEHGECVCGRCSCAAGYSGPACQCLEGHAACRSPENNEICSGNGECVCGRCVCRAGAGRERRCAGQFCEACPDQ